MKLHPRCDGCRYNPEPPTQIMPENVAAWHVFLVCRRQWRSGFSGAYAIDGNFTWKVLEDMKAPNKTETFCRVDSLASFYLEALRKQNGR